MKLLFSLLLLNLSAAHPVLAEEKRLADCAAPCEDRAKKEELSTTTDISAPPCTQTDGAPCTEPETHGTLPSGFDFPDDQDTILE